MSQVITGPRVGISDAPARRRVRLSLLRPILMLGGIAAVVVGAGYWWLTGGQIVSIDDSYVRAAKEVIATDVSGIVAAVPVPEGQHVNKGDVLLRLDPLPFKLALDGAIAYRDGMLTTLDAERLDYQRMLRDADVKQAMVQSGQAVVG